MAGKIPPDAFEQYVGLGEQRSYALLAESFGCTKRAVTFRASQECWQERLTKIEDESKRRVDEKLVETKGEVRERHLRSLRAIQGRALQALQTMPMRTASEAAKALMAAIKAEAALMGLERRESMTMAELIAGSVHPVENVAEGDKRINGVD